MESTVVPPMTLIDQADKALYHAKRLGRNRLIHFDDLEDRGDAADEAIADSLGWPGVSRSSASQRPLPPPIGSWPLYQ
jgi:hypothetical protein